MEWKVLEPGEVFERRYRIDSVLGVGGFAHVYRATQVDLDREVALKILRPAKTNNAQGDAKAAAVKTWVQRFRREAKVISKLRDPHTITMYDYGNTSTDMSYMVFEYVSGQSLDVAIREQGPFSPDRVVSILKQCLTSIHEAHAMGILHRDLKPANILVYDHVGRRDQVKVLDFGIAKPMMDEQVTTGADLTMDGTILGTPRYMSPEQLKGDNMGPPSDLYSLGLVAFEMLTGSKAISGNTTMTVISKQLSPEPIMLPAEVTAPERFRSIIHKMLLKDQGRRYQDAMELLADLETWREPAPLSETTISLGPEDIERISQDDDPSRATIPLPKPMESDEVAPPQEPSGESRPVPVAAPVTPDPTPEPSGDHSVVLEAMGNKAPVRLIGAVLMVVVILLVVVAIDFGGDEEEADPTDPVVAVEDPAEEAEEVETVRLQVETDPAGANIIIDGVYVGISPIAKDLEHSAFPVEVTALMEDGRRADQVLEGPQELLELELEAPTTEVAAAEESGESEAERRQRQEEELRRAQERADEERRAEERRRAEAERRRREREAQQAAAAAAGETESSGADGLGDNGSGDNGSGNGGFFSLD